MSSRKYIIVSQVVDISQYDPRPKDSFFVDTNVWFWVASQIASQGLSRFRAKQIRIYPDFIKKVLNVKGTLYRSELSFSELSNLIERTEYDIFKKETGIDISPKAYRHEYAHRRPDVIEEIELTWSQVEAMSVSIPVHLTSDFTHKVIERMGNHKLDAYDACMVESLLAEGIPLQIISDDADFSSVGDVTLFTANSGVLDSVNG
ncbi:MAG: PIN domain-containing protein [Methanomicrobiales archaeon]|nr:PIN domain-containing protein [Methanomicrobiales archaeon]